MAEFGVTGLDELILSMQEIAQIPDDVVDDILNAQADVTVEAQKAAGRQLGVEAPGSGLTLRSIKKGRVKLRKGQRVLYITPTGSRKRGKTRTRNTEIAFINEFGKKGQKARPFIKLGNEKSAEAATAAGFRVYDRWLKSKNL